VVASQLPHAPGLALIASARAAFAEATMLMFSLCGGLALLAALAAVVLLRGRTGAISPDQQPEPVPHDGTRLKRLGRRSQPQHVAARPLSSLGSPHH
jgi:hypothetical protein